MQGSAALALLAAFSWFFLVRVPARTTYLTARNFRLLADSCDQIKAGIGTLYTSLTNAASEAVDPRKGDGTWGKADVTMALQNVTPKLEIVVFPDLEGPSNNRLRNVTLNVRRDLDNSWLHFKYVEASQPASPKTSATPTNASASARSSETNRSAAATAATGQQETNTLETPPLNQGTLRFEVRTEFQQFIRRLVTRHELDEVFLAEENGEVIFQDAGGQARIMRLPVLADISGKTNVIAIDAATLSHLQLSGTDYKLFAQPLHFALPYAAGETNALFKWVLVGLVKTKTFQAQTLDVPFTVIIVSVFAVVLVLLSWPFLNVVLAGPYEELRVFDAFCAAAASFLTCGAVALLLLDLNAYPPIQLRMDKQLETFAKQISTNLLDELSAVNRQLLEFDRQRQLAPSTFGNAAFANSALTNTASPNNTRTNVLSSTCDLGPTCTNSFYPFLRMAVWANAGGEQLYKWAAGPTVTPFVPVGDRNYFRQIKEGQPWPWGLPQDYAFFAFTNGFYLEPIYSRTRGENVSIFSIAAPPPLSGATNHSFWQQEKTNPPVVLYAEFRPLSLMRAVIPEGYGFSIIDTNGRVLFHPEERRNLRENFVTECEDHPRLRAAIHSRTTDSFDANYFRQPHSLYVMPVPGFPWTLVTFRDERVLGTARVEMLSVSGVLFSIYTLLVLGGLAVIYLAHSRRHPAWVWPDQERTHSYHWIIATNLLVVLAFALASLLFRSPAALLTEIVVLLLIALGVASQVLKEPGSFGRNPWKGFKWLRQLIVTRLDEARRAANLAVGALPDATSQSISPRARRLAKWSRALKRLPWPPPFRAAYVMALGSMLAVLTLLPGVAFFEIGFAQEMERFVKHGQLKIAHDLHERADRARADSRNRPKPDRTNFVNARIEIRWDNYAGISFKTIVHTNPAADTPARHQQPIDAQLLMMRPHYNEMTEANAGLAFDAAADGSWHSMQDGWRLSTWVASKSPEAKPRSITVVSDVPRLSWPGLDAFGLAWYLTLAVALSAPFLFAWLLARRLFLWHVPRSAAEKADVPLRLTAPVAAPNGGDGAKDPFVAVEATHFYFLDLKSPDDRDVLARPRRHEIEKDAVLVLSNIDSTWPEPDCDKRKEEWLKAMVRDHAKTVVIIEPEHSETKSAGATSAELLATLADARFLESKPAGGKSAAEKPAEFGSSSSIRYALAQEAAANHEKLWKDCLPIEQLTLLQVARTGLANSERPEVRTLLARGMLRRDPELRLPNESFRRFVVAKGQPDITVPEEAGDTIGSWRSMKGALWVLLTGVAAFLFLTQREVWNIMLGLVPAFMAGFTSLSHLSKLFQKPKAEQK